MKKYTLFIIHFFLILLPVKLIAAPPVLNKVLVADVTDRSFSIIYTSSEKGTPKLELYSDSAALNQLFNYTLTIYPVNINNKATNNNAIPDSGFSNRQLIIDSAKARGIVKLNISGLSPNTQYYVKYGAENSATAELTLCPDSGLALCADAVLTPVAVKTAKKITRSQQIDGLSTLYTNDISLFVKQDAVIGDLIIVMAENTRYPVSVFAGDGPPPPFVFIDMNNFSTLEQDSTYVVHGFDEQAQGNYGESIVIRKYSGLSGDTMQRGLVGIASNTGMPVDMVERTMADCNGDGKVNGYDSLVLQYVINKNISSIDYSKIAFHPFLCNIFSQEGLNNVSSLSAIDSSDLSILSDVLVGKKQRENLPEAP